MGASSKSCISLPRCHILCSTNPEILFDSRWKKLAFRAKERTQAATHQGCTDLFSRL